MKAMTADWYPLNGYYLMKKQTELFSMALTRKSAGICQALEQSFDENTSSRQEKRPGAGNERISYEI